MKWIPLEAVLIICFFIAMAGLFFVNGYVVEHDRQIFQRHLEDTVYQVQRPLNMKIFELRDSIERLKFELIINAHN